MKTMNKIIKGTALSMIMVLGLSISMVFATPKQDAHASMFMDIAGATYAYKNRGTLENMYHSAKNKAHVTGMPHFKVNKKGKVRDLIVVQTKQKTYKIGWFKKTFVNGFLKYKNYITNFFKKNVINKVK